MPVAAIQRFMKLESAAGILLGIAALIAIILNNSPFSHLYDSILITRVSIQIGDFIIDKPFLLWINDGLMAVFFLLVGLEIKREILEGQLSNKDQIILPTLAAFGGIVIPALIYVYINWDSKETLKGWAIPAATDIAFALGILTLLGKRVNENLKICLLTIAILDDLAAITIIAVFYTKDLSLASLGFGGLAILILFFLNYRGVTKLAPYIVTGITLWICVLKSGVHATLAGVVLAFFIPVKKKNAAGKVPLQELEHDLHPWVTFGILPIFAFANAGVSFAGLSMDMFLQPITLGVALGLFFGKQIGVMLMTGLGILLKLCRLPSGVSWKAYYGMACITGVGFTMSLFIGTLAFEDVANQAAVRLGVITGSFLSGLLGFMVIRLSCPKQSPRTETQPSP